VIVDVQVGVTDMCILGHVPSSSTIGEI